MNSTSPIRRAAGRLTGLRKWAARHQKLFWAGVIAVVLLTQWPMLKGVSYIPVLIDVDRDDTVPERYSVRGIPTVLVLEGRVVRRANFLSAAAVVSFLSEGTEPAAN